MSLSFIKAQRQEDYVELKNPIWTSALDVLGVVHFSAPSRGNGHSFAFGRCLGRPWTLCKKCLTVSGNRTKAGEPVAVSSEQWANFMKIESTIRTFRETGFVYTRGQRWTQSTHMIAPKILPNISVFLRFWTVTRLPSWSLTPHHEGL